MVINIFLFVNVQHSPYIYSLYTFLVPLSSIHAYVLSYFPPFHHTIRSAQSTFFSYIISLQLTLLYMYGLFILVFNSYYRTTLFLLSYLILSYLTPFLQCFGAGAGAALFGWSRSQKNYAVSAPAPAPL